jgi:hypothetical protein
MALPVEPRHTEPLFSQILCFLWTKQVDGHTKQKRRLVAKKRISAGIEMGGLGIQHPDEIIQGFQLNLLQKIHKQGRAHLAGNLPSILTGLLDRANRPSLAEHILRFGPKQWKITGQRLMPWNTQLLMPLTQLLLSLHPMRPPEICGILLPLTDILTLVKFSLLALQRVACLQIVGSSLSHNYWRLMISLGGSQRRKTEFCLRTCHLSAPTAQTSPLH